MSALRAWRERVLMTPLLSPGMTYQVEMGGKVQLERAGRPVHLLGLELECSVEYQVVGDPVVPLPGQYKRACLSNIVLVSDQHRWIDALDGDQVHLLSEKRRGSGFGVGPLLADPLVPQPDASEDTPDAGEVAALTNKLKAAINDKLGPKINAILLGHHTDPDPIPPEVTGGEGAPPSFRESIVYWAGGLGDSLQDGAIPMALLDHTKGSNGLSFRIPANFKGSANYIITGVQVHVYAILIALDELRIPTPHQMRTYTEAETDFTVRPRGRVAALFIRDEVDASGAIQTPDMSRYDDITLTVDDEVLFHAFTAEELVEMANDRRPLGVRPFGGLTGEYVDPLDVLPIVAAHAAVHARALRPGVRPFGGLTGEYVDPLDVLPIVAAHAGTKRTRMHSGVFRIEIGDRRDADGNERKSSRILIHETGRQTQAHLRAMARAMGAPPIGAKGGPVLEPRFSVKGKRSATHPVADVLDHAMYWPGMGGKLHFTVPAAKLSRKLAAARR